MKGGNGLGHRGGTSPYKTFSSSPRDKIRIDSNRRETLYVHSRLTVLFLTLYPSLHVTLHIGNCLKALAKLRIHILNIQVIYLNLSKW